MVRIRFSPPGAATTVSGVVALNPGEETALLHALSSMGVPVTDLRRRGPAELR